jgi:hypothetical protein
MPIGLVTLSSVMKSPMTVDSREQQAPISKLGTYLIADPKGTVVERADLCTRTGRQVAAMVAGARDSGEGHGNGHAIDMNDPFVTRFRRSRKVLLKHHKASAYVGHGYEYHVAVAVYSPSVARPVQPVALPALASQAIPDCAADFRRVWSRVTGRWPERVVDEPM